MIYCGSKWVNMSLYHYEAKYHQSCRLLFNNSKLERARKRSANEKDTGECSKPIKSRRSSFGNNVCFLCEQEAPKSDLRRAMTIELDRRLNECARNLEDGKLLATLSGGDVVAQELKYHRNCLRALYNRERALTINALPYLSQNSETLLNGNISFSEHFNSYIFLTVQDFIKLTKRFDSN